MQKIGQIVGLSIMFLCSFTAYASSCPEDFVGADGAVNSRFIESERKELSVVPQEVVDTVYTNGWKVKITDKNLGAYFYGLSGGIAGVCDPSTKTIYLEDRDSAVRRAGIHELGHAFDLCSGGRNYHSTCAEFQDIFSAEKSNFRYSTGNGDGHEFSNAMEYYASVFEDICKDDARIKQALPRTYAFIKSDMNKVIESRNVEEQNSINKSSGSNSISFGPAATDAKFIKGLK